MIPARRGFSLVELMIVVAIIGLLASIAVPNFIAMQMRAKRAELPTMVNGIQSAEVLYESTFDAYLPLPAAPDASPGPRMRDWTVTGGNWTSLGWGPDGQLRGSYSADATTSDFTVYGVSDVDGDAAQAQYTSTTSINSTLNTASDVF